MKATELSLDGTDLRIVAMLGGDGRCGNNEIARKLGVSEGTVRKRIKRLTDSGAIRVEALVNPDVLEDRHLALLEIKVAVSKELESVAEKIAALPGVVSVHIITGGMDIMAEVLVESKFGLIEFIGTHLASVNGIASTETHIVMKHYGKWLPAKNLQEVQNFAKA